MLAGMTPDQLRGVYAKLSWARAHFHTMDAELQAWVKDDAHRIIYERNEDFTQHYLRADFGSQPRHDRWPLMIGDCVTNLRDTLDHLIYAIAHLPGMPFPSEADKAAFIIRDAPGKFTKDAKTRLCSVPNVVRDAVLSFQPFNRPNGVRLPVLSLLSELANGSKHKLLSVTLLSPEKMDVEFISDSNVTHDPAPIAALNKSGIMEGHPFFVVETVPDPNFRMKSGEIHFGIAIAHSPLPGEASFDAGHTPYGIFLKSMFDEVEQVLNTITALV
jgi:hypothetical protein